ncbi:band 7 protein [Zhengella mangrovi]|uniref:Band 7 protein n=1 Tax=Zhengella mangrovi TaxID=1982044 RepID=A0A2G1QMF3_9HYPH|nr:SPFH domain-containing protein [Zhengella mangrovi]PHP66408.1 band 7 protein [Zhengella mangrovi]
MAQISRYPFIRHLRAETSSHIRLFRNGRETRAGRGLSVWFSPVGASISEIPMDDRELTFMVSNQSADYQDVSVQGTILWRVADAGCLSERVDFTIDLKTGQHAAKPQDHIHSVLTGLAREFSDTYVKGKAIRDLLDAGLAPLQAALNAGFAAEAALADMGLTVIAVRVAALTPSSELARALQVPTFEAMQQKADEATFARRALAVEKERAIAENELANRIELAARRRDLIAREDENARSEAQADAAAQSIRAEGGARARTIEAEAEATRIRTVEQAAAEMEQLRMAAVAGMPTAALLALAAREFASKLDRIDSVTVTPDMLAGLAGQLRGLVAQGREP